MSEELTEIQSNILTYIPNSFLDKYLRKNYERKPLPATYNSQGLILFSNILNFSNITQHYLKDTQNGLEITANIHKQFVELLQDHIKGTGADMLRHSTDQIIFYWEIPTSETDKCLDVLCKVVTYQILQLKQVLKEKFLTNDLHLNFSFILAEGEFSTLFLGENQTVTDYIYTGSSLIEIFDCPRPEIEDILLLVNQKVMQRVQKDFQVNSIDYIQDEDRHEPSNFFLIRKAYDNCEAAHLSIEGIDLRRMIKQEHYQKLQDEVKYYIPKCLESYIMNGIEAWGCELRKVTVAFFSVPIDIKSLAREAELAKLQGIIVGIQHIVKNYKGFIYRTYLDQKGLNVFIIFGLYPEYHPKNAVRCILSAFAITNDLFKRGLPTFVGISTGEVLLSICGHLQKDLFIIGEPLYTAFILSLVALKDGSKKIIVDFESKVAAEMKLSFLLYKNPVFTGKMVEGIYELIYTGSPLPSLPLNLFPEIRTHHFNMDYSNASTLDEKMTSLFMVGRDIELQSGKQIFLQYLRNHLKPNLLMIVGSYGIGKSLFAKNLLENIVEILDKSTFNISRTGVPILVSSINPTNKAQKLNGWRFIMREILNQLSFSYGQQKEEFLYDILQNEPDLQFYIYLLRDILDLNIATSNRNTEEERISLNQENESDVSDYEQKIIIRILVILLQCFLGEKVTFSNAESSRTSKQRETFKEATSPLIICLDDIQDHDNLSWNLLSEVTKKLQKIFVIGILRDDEANIETIRNIEEGMRNLRANQSLTINKITLERIKQNDIAIIARRMLGDRDLSEDLKKLISAKSEGNPLTVVNLLDTLLKQSMMQDVSGVVYPADNLQKLIKLDQFIEIKVPFVKQKVNGSLLDTLTFIQYNLLKVASVIGETFDLKTLVVTNPFHMRLLPYNLLVSSLQELRRLSILDLADNRSKNTSYRFAISFLRETIYQRISPFLRKKQHRIVALNYEDQIEGQVKTEQIISYQWLLSEQGQKNKNDSTRRAFLLRKINGIIAQPIKRGDLIIKIGQLEKKSIKTERKWTLRFVALTQNALKYYRSEREFNEKPIFQAGAIPLKYIISISLVFLENPNNIEQKSSFKILAAKWEKGSQESTIREFYFACNSNEEAEDWQTCIEYMRNKMVYEDFLQNYESNNKSNSRQMSPASTKNIYPQNLKVDVKEKPNFRGFTRNYDQEDYEARDNLTPEGSPNRKAKFQETSKLMPPVYGRNDTNEGMDVIKRQKNKELLKTFLNKGQIVFWSYLCSAPFKASLKGKGFGKNPDILLSKQELMRIDPNLVRSEPNLDLSKRESTVAKLPYEIDKAITEKIASFDKPKFEFKSNLSSKSEISPPLISGLESKGLRSREFDETIGSTRSPLQFVSTYEEDISPRKEYFIEKKTVVPKNLGSSFKNDNCSEIIEEVVKPQSATKSGPRNREEESPSLKMGNKTLLTKVAFGPKVTRNLSRPNIYGRYEFLPTFFADSYVDDKIFISKSNQVLKAVNKVRNITKANIPNNLDMIIKTIQGPDGDVYILAEESHERLKNNRGKSIQSSRLEDESPIYKSPKFSKDFTWTGYKLPEKQQYDMQKVDRVIERIQANKNNQNTSDSYFVPSYSKPKPLFPDNNSLSAKSPVSHTRYKSDFNLKTSFPNELNKSSDLQNETNFSSRYLEPNDSKSFILNRPEHYAREKTAYGASPLSQNELLRNDSSLLKPTQDFSPSLQTVQTTSPYSANLKSQEPSPLLKSSRNLDFTKIPTAYIPETNASDTRFSDFKKYNTSLPNNSRDPPLDKYNLSNDFYNRSPNTQNSQQTYFKSSNTDNRSVSPLRDQGTKSRTTFNQPTPASFEPKYRKAGEPQFGLPAQHLDYEKAKLQLGPATISFAINVDDPRTQKVSPASNETKNSPFTVNRPTSTLHPSEYLCLAYTKRETVSQDGDYLKLGKREFVVVTRLYEKRGLAELLWNGKTGLFPLNDLELISPDGKVENERNVVIGGFEEASHGLKNQNYYMGYNDISKNRYDNQTNTNNLSGKKLSSEPTGPRFGNSEGFNLQNPDTRDPSNKMPSKMMQRQLKRMQNQETSQFSEGSSFMSNISGLGGFNNFE